MPFSQYYFYLNWLHSASLIRLLSSRNDFSFDLSLIDFQVFVLVVSSVLSFFGPSIIFLTILEYLIGVPIYSLAFSWILILSFCLIQIAL
jgi:hypothetical protein